VNSRADLSFISISPSFPTDAEISRTFPSVFASSK
jgi:hypothetical protein